MVDLNYVVRGLNESVELSRCRDSEGLVSYEWRRNCSPRGPACSGAAALHDAERHLTPFGADEIKAAQKTGIRLLISVCVISCGGPPRYREISSHYQSPGSRRVLSCKQAAKLTEVILVLIFYYAPPEKDEFRVLCKYLVREMNYR